MYSDSCIKVSEKCKLVNFYEISVLKVSSQVNYVNFLSYKDLGKTHTV